MSGAPLYRRPLLTDSQDGLERLLEEATFTDTEEEVGRHTVLRIPPEKLHFPDEPLKTLLAALFLGVSMVVTTIALIITNQRLPDLPPLPDLVLDHVRYIEDGLVVSEKIMLTSMLLGIAVAFAHIHRTIILRRIFFIMGLMYFYRAITMQLTVLPKPDPKWKCPKHVGTLDGTAILAKVVHVAVGGGVSLGEQQNLCGDYIFSGHTMILAVSYLTVRDYSPRKLFLLPWASLALSTAGVVMLLLGRGHYSIDVLLAYYVTTRVWWFYHLMADSPSFRIVGARSFLGQFWWWRLFTFWERNVPGPLPQRYSLPLPRGCREGRLFRRLVCRRRETPSTGDP